MCLHTAKVEVTSYLRSRNVFKQFRANIWILKLRFCFKVYLRSLWWKKTIRMKNFKNQMLTRNTSLNSFLDHRLEATATLGTYMYYWILLELIIFTFVLYILFYLSYSFSIFIILCIMRHQKLPTSCILSILSILFAFCF